MGTNTNRYVDVIIFIKEFIESTLLLFFFFPSTKYRKENRIAATTMIFRTIFMLIIRISG